MTKITTPRKRGKSSNVVDATNDQHARHLASSRSRIARTPSSVRVNVAFATTVIRVIREDKETFDMMWREFIHRVDERMSHHEFFAHILTHALENMPDLIARWERRDLSYVAERALAAAVAEMNGRPDGGPAA